MPQRHILLSAFFLVCLSGCYSSKQDNPFDPIRTPPVVLEEAEFDDVTQTATLVWTAYHGVEPFQRYDILRRAPGEAPSVVGTSGTVGDTTYVDDSILPGITYSYRVWIVNTSDLPVGSLDSLSGNVAPPIQVFDPVFDHRAAMDVELIQHLGLTHLLLKDRDQVAVVELAQVRVVLV